MPNRSQPLEGPGYRALTTMSFGLLGCALCVTGAGATSSL
jgi:hypothetical protein